MILKRFGSHQVSFGIRIGMGITAAVLIAIARNTVKRKGLLIGMYKRLEAPSIAYGSPRNHP